MKRWEFGFGEVGAGLDRDPEGFGELMIHTSQNPVSSLPDICLLLRKVPIVFFKIVIFVSFKIRLISRQHVYNAGALVCQVMKPHQVKAVNHIARVAFEFVPGFIEFVGEFQRISVVQYKRGAGLHRGAASPGSFCQNA